jgi:glycine oxidase
MDAMSSLPNTHSDYLIIGAGVLGLGCAAALLQQGATVTLVERGVCGGESSWAGAGILSVLCPWDYPDAVTQLALRGSGLFPAWAHELHETTGIDPEYIVSGMKVLPPFDRDLALGWAAAHGLNVAPENDALLLPDVAQVRNPRLIRALQRKIEMLGGRIIEQCEVQALGVQNEQIVNVQTSCGVLTAERYIVTAGAWSQAVLGEYALRLEIKPMRGQMLLFKFAAPPISTIMFQQKLYLVPRRDGHLLVGSTLEDVGFDKNTTSAARDDLLQRASRILPQLQTTPLLRQWAGLRPASLHNIPTIGQHPQLQNLYLNTGHFRYGVAMMPASVEMLMNDLMGVPQALDVAPYRMK